MRRLLTAALRCATRARTRVYGLACELHARRYFGPAEQGRPLPDEPCTHDCQECSDRGLCLRDWDEPWERRDPQDAAERAEPYVWDRDWTELD